MGLKRYAVFAYDDYYPGGGWSDFEEAFDTVEAARASITGPRAPWRSPDKKRYFDNYEIIDLQTGERVE